MPEIDGTLAESIVRVVNALRGLNLRKSPSVAESIDWARTLLALGADTLDEQVVHESLGVILKHQEDIRAAHAGLTLESGSAPS